MQTIEYTTIDKSGWGDGPWLGEFDKRQWRDEETGFPCLILRANPLLGNLCGYVGVSRCHPACGVDYMDLSWIDVHGGLTFSDGCSHGDESRSICHKVDDGEDDEVWWLGFDCGHAGDLSPALVAYLGNNPFGDRTYRDVAYVEAQVLGLARQLREMQQGGAAVSVLGL